MATSPKNTMVLAPENDAFGLPPSSYVSDSMIKNSMPIIQIVPGIPNFQEGLTLFKIDTDEGQIQYRKALANHGFTLKSNSVNLAYIADNFPTDSFSNEYGETFLQKFTDVASQGMQQLAQMTGSTTGTEALTKLGSGVANVTEGMEGNLGSMLNSGANAGLDMVKGLTAMKNNLAKNSNFLGGALNTVDKMLGGARVDFPNIWRNSGFSPSYTITVRLYNPNPGNPNATKRYIVGPLAAILCLAIPRSEDGKTFTWPFFVRARSSGIWKLDPGVITNVTVVKGGDQQQIAYNQSLAMVDIRIDFASLYSSMVLETDTNFETERPTIRKYLDTLLETDENLYYRRDKMRELASGAAGAALSGSGGIKISGVSNPAAALAKSISDGKIAAAKKRQAPQVIETAVNDRVNSSIASVESQLVNAARGSGFYPSSIG